MTGAPSDPAPMASTSRVREPAQLRNAPGALAAREGLGSRDAEYLPAPGPVEPHAQEGPTAATLAALGAFLIEREPDPAVDVGPLALAFEATDEAVQELRVGCLAGGEQIVAARPWPDGAVGQRGPAPDRALPLGGHHRVDEVAGRGAEPFCGKQHEPASEDLLREGELAAGCGNVAAPEGIDEHHNAPGVGRDALAERLGHVRLALGHRTGARLGVGQQPAQILVDELGCGHRRPPVAPGIFEQAEVALAAVLVTVEQLERTEDGRRDVGRRALWRQIRSQWAEERGPSTRSRTSGSDYASLEDASPAPKRGDVGSRQTEPLASHALLGKAGVPVRLDSCWIVGLDLVDEGRLDGGHDAELGEPTVHKIRPPNLELAGMSPR